MGSSIFLTGDLLLLETAPPKDLPYSLYVQ